MIDIGAFAGQIFVIVLLLVIAIFVVVVIFRSSDVCWYYQSPTCLSWIILAHLRRLAS